MNNGPLKFGDMAIGSSSRYHREKECFDLMKRESMVLGLALFFSMSIMGWIIWIERPSVTTSSGVTPSEASQDATVVLALDQDRVVELISTAEADGQDVESRILLAGLYFDSHRFGQAIPWYEEVVALMPDDVRASTNLGISYYYVGSFERAVEQLERSLEIEPTHAQALISLGVAKAFGLEDLDGASAAWQRVLEVAPDGPEAVAARDALSRLQENYDDIGALGSVSQSDSR